MAKFFTTRLWASLRFPLIALALMWIIQIVQWLLGIELGFLGIYPRTIEGLKGILFAPMVHGDFGHLLSNSPPFLVLTAMVLFFYRRIALPAFVLIYLLTGMAVWIFGREVFHIGASGVIYGLVAFVFWNGVFRRNLKSMALAAIVLFYYGSMVAGIVPGQSGISWESHLLGAISGILVSFGFKKRLEPDEERQKPALEQPSDTFFLNRDAFEKTREQRQREQQERDSSLPRWFSDRT